MQPLSELGRWTVVIGLGIIAVGVLLWLIGQIPGLNRIPGTWTWESDNIKIIAPIGLMILRSILLTLVLNVVLRMFR